MSAKWVVIHFSPIEKYPPACNFIRYAALQKKNFEVLTIHPDKVKKPLAVKGVKIRRLGRDKPRNRLLRLWFYMQFNIRAVLIVARKRPSCIFYYETISSFAPWWYKKWMRNRVRIFVHYHEYMTQEEYRSGMLLVRWLYNKEKTNLPTAAWVSHTNYDRLGFFLKDLGNKRPPVTGILPNYPPASWYAGEVTVKSNDDRRIAFVYVGGLSLDTMFTREMARFIAAHPDSCYWDIYSDNMHPEVSLFLENLQAENIFFKGAVEYEQLPVILPQYDIGLILHNGNTMNYAYNAPNKFFEYYAAGLNVWYPEQITGLKPFEKTAGKPWVKSVKFNQLQMPPKNEAMRGIEQNRQQYKAEEVYGPFLDLLSA